MKEKLQPIERRPDGSLPRMTPGQRRKATALIRKTCCNYDNGNCILLDGGEKCVCVQSISYSVCCTWFRRAVLPQDKPLEAEIFHSGNVKCCAVCGAAFVPAPTGRNTAEPAPGEYIDSRRTKVTAKDVQMRTVKGRISKAIKALRASFRDGP